MDTVPKKYKGFPNLGRILGILLPCSYLLLTYARESGVKPGTPGLTHTKENIK
jgi:hypothetical protein